MALKIANRAKSVKPRDLANIVMSGHKGGPGKQEGDLGKGPGATPAAYGTNAGDMNGAGGQSVGSLWGNGSGPFGA